MFRGNGAEMEEASELLEEWEASACGFNAIPGK